MKKAEYKLHKAFFNALDSYMTDGFIVKEKCTSFNDCYAIIEKDRRIFLLTADFISLCLSLFTYPKRKLLSKTTFEN